MVVYDFSDVYINLTVSQLCKFALSDKLQYIKKQTKSLSNRFGSHSNYVIFMDSSSVVIGIFALPVTGPDIFFYNYENNRSAESGRRKDILLRLLPAIRGGGKN